MCVLMATEAQFVMKVNNSPTINFAVGVPFSFGGGGNKGEKCVSEGQNPRLSQKWLIFVGVIFFSDQGQEWEEQSLQLGPMPLSCATTEIKGNASRVSNIQF